MKLKAAFAGVLSAFFAAQAHAAPVDLSTWTIDGAGSWSLAPDNNSAFQSLNSAPTVLQNGTNSQGNSLAGTITVEEVSDDDFIGFVLGYTQGDIDGNADTDYILIDWKQGTQGGWDAGLSISRVTGPIQASGVDTGADAWDHDGNVELLARATNLGLTGWADNTTYDFRIDFAETFIQVFVNGVLELNIAGVFADGAFGFYNFSQPGVRYAGITEDVLPPSDVPIPAALPLLISGLGALGFFSRRRKTA
jgi:hypothetical protein